MSDEPLVLFPWTGPDGIVHEREPNSEGTLCGIRCEGPSHTYAAKDGCGTCVTAATDEWARRHKCGPKCRVPYEHALPALDQRIPQASEGAKLARTLSLSRYVSNIAGANTFSSSLRLMTHLDRADQTQRRVARSRS